MSRNGQSQGNQHAGYELSVGSDPRLVQAEIAKIQPSEVYLHFGGSGDAATDETA